MKCAVVTTSRADYGLLKWLVAELKTSLTLTCQLVVSGTHLQDAHGMTVREIEADGNAISARVLMDMGGGQDTQVAQSMAEGLSGFATAFEALQPDIVILLGDRYEVYAAMSTATVMRLPVAHLCGGDVTEGAYDEVFRHAISKAASLHFPSNPESAIRLQQLGEPAERIHMVGSTGLDGLHHMEWLDRDTLFERLNFTPQARNIVVTHHPVTREKGGAAGEITQVLAGLDSFGPDLGIIFTGVNADSEGDVIQSARPMRLSVTPPVAFTKFRPCACQLSISAIVKPGDFRRALFSIHPLTPALLPKPWRAPLRRMYHRLPILMGMVIAARGSCAC